mmetsp:Transcript_72286/g.156956  ORF Transcript_72286/g.156956 Transcript_72286/m.156956 type:complete len:575 (+) Transcript_72286:62-1786(+)
MMPLNLALLWLISASIAWTGGGVAQWSQASHDKLELETQEMASSSAWAEEEVLVVIAKLYWVFSNPVVVGKAYLVNNPAHECRMGESYPPTEPCPNDGIIDDIKPTASKFLRLGFHDCLKYEDGSGGCDGCLSFSNMFYRYDEAERMSMPDVTVTDNNNLAFVADILEEIYTRTDFPLNSPSLRQSLQESGKSRADLWALAALTATHFSLVENNKACQGEKDFATAGRCGHLFRHIPTDFPCMIDMNFSMQFYTGRKDCSSEQRPNETTWYRRRAYEASRHEFHPNPHGNGVETGDFFKDWFNFTRRETVAIMGAHALGSFHGSVSLFKYDWTKGQSHILNNQYYRALVKAPSKMSTCGDPPQWTGGPQGSEAPTGWYVRPLRKSVSGGPYLWFHYYLRCPECRGRKNVETEGDGFFKSDFCCQQCDTMKVKTIHPGCYRKIAKDETALNSDLGLYLLFETGKGGIPLGCKGLSTKKQKWTAHNIMNGRKGLDFYKAEPRCNKQKLGDGKGTLKMYQLVERYSENQEAWMDDFIPALQKMLANGYKMKKLTASFDFNGLNCNHNYWGFKCTKSN